MTCHGHGTSCRMHLQSRSQAALRVPRRCLRLRTSPAAPPCTLDPQVAVQQSVKPLIEEFLAGLHVECPRLGFRDVVDEAQVWETGEPSSLLPPALERAAAEVLLACIRSLRGSEPAGRVARLLLLLLPRAALPCLPPALRPAPLPPTQAAQHVQLITAAIAHEVNRDSEATVFLRAHSKNESAVSAGSCSGCVGVGLATPPA